jgi:Skp family chaperone for outer membrane proteins
MPGGVSWPSRRDLLAAAAGALALAALPAPAQPPPGIAVVSRDRILREARAARRLREAEEEMTARLQRQIDEAKVRFAAEEEELTRLRGELPVPEFEARVGEFDRRVRLARRVAQERAAALQKGFQDARAAIVAALPTLMERLRTEAGARLIVDGDEVLAADPAFDLTDRAIALFDAEGPSPGIPDVDLSQPLAGPPAAARPAEPGPEPGPEP